MIPAFDKLPRNYAGACAFAIALCSPVIAMSDSSLSGEGLLSEIDQWKVLEQSSVDDQRPPPRQNISLRAAPFDSEQSINDFLSLGFLYSDTPSTVVNGERLFYQMQERSIFGFPLAGLWPAGVAPWVGLPPEVASTRGVDGIFQGIERTISTYARNEERNFVAVWQDGVSNLVGPLRFFGEDLSVSVRQSGLGNLAYLGAPFGNAQSVGVIQFGTNVADVFFADFGEDNSVFMEQIGVATASVIAEGERNFVEAYQSYDNGVGGNNMFRVEIDGLDNFLTIDQSGDNMMQISVIGNSNNRSSSRDSTLKTLGISQGVLLQTGKQGSLFIDVNGSENRFGSKQSGNRGTVTLTQTGDQNVSGVVQSGDGSAVSVFQSGSGNSVSVSQ
ncbi:curlin repeat-containing protein [Roseinatronobacter thiooxidans]|nr:curlin repeat-containing protein [Roseinatronobacter thiooxidans]